MLFARLWSFLYFQNFLAFLLLHYRTNCEDILFTARLVIFLIWPLNQSNSPPKGSNSVHEILEKMIATIFLIIIFTQNQLKTYQFLTLITPLSPVGQFHFWPFTLIPIKGPSSTTFIFFPKLIALSLLFCHLWVHIYIVLVTEQWNICI